MKKFILTLSTATFIFIGTAKAQIIGINEDNFEVWHSDPANAAALDPNTGATNTDGWQCMNFLSSVLTGNSPVSVFKDSTSPLPYQGKYACKIVSVKLTATSYNYVKSFARDTVGAVVTGSIATTPSPSFKLGVKHISRMTSFSFYYQYFPTVNVTSDTAFCAVVLSHFSGGKRNTLGSGIKMINSAASWTQGIVNITYDSAVGNPDTVSVIFSSSSNYKPQLGSTLYIDGASVLAVNDISAPSAHVDVYPNPASNQVNFHISTTNGDEGYSIAVYDVTGKKLNTYPVKNDLASVNTSAYSSGLYFYELYDKNGAQMKVGKFSVVK